MEIKPDEDERIIHIEMERLKDFENHPFKVCSDQQMAQLTASIRQYGILNPLIVRPVPDGMYEIISGHRRKYAAEQLGFRKVPVIIRYMKDDDAIISMVDANLQRERICPSEKAFAYKMKYDAVKRRSGRRKSGQNEYALKGKRTIDLLGEKFGDSPKQVQRYLKITELIPELLEILDDGFLSFNPAFEIAFLSKNDQKQLLDVMNYTQSMPSISQAQRIKKLGQEGNLTKERIQNILGEVKKGETERVVFKNKQLYRYFPKTYSVTQMKREILEILKLWMNQGREKRKEEGKCQQ